MKLSVTRESVQIILLVGEPMVLYRNTPHFSVILAKGTSSMTSDLFLWELFSLKGLFIIPHRRRRG